MEKFLLYRNELGDVHVDVLLQEETLWLTQKAIGELFGVESHTITYHIKEIFKSGELTPESTTRKIRGVQKEGNREVNRNLDFYNLDVGIAKNYLNEQHISELNRIISAYLDLAENNANRNMLMKMKDWRLFLENFLKLSNYPILNRKGKVSALEAKIRAEQEYDNYRVIQDKNYESDFDGELKRLEEATILYKKQNK